MKRFVYSVVTLITLIFVSREITISQVQWKSLGGPTAAQRELTLALNDSGHIFVGGELGIFRSTNNGGTWERKVQGLTVTYTQRIVMGKNHDIFACTNGGGIFRSTNNGDLWDYLGLRLEDVRGCVVTDSGYIIALTRTDGIYKSKDNGATWQQTSRIRGLGNIQKNSLGEIFVVVPQSVYRSTDNGYTWMSIFDASPFGGAPALSMTYNNAGDLFIGTDLKGIFKSTDRGASWTHVTTPPESLTLKYWNAWEVEALVANQKGHVFAGVVNDFITQLDSERVAMSTDNGDSWQLVANGLPLYAGVYSLAVDDSGYVLAGVTGNGVYKTTKSTIITDVHEYDSGPPKTYSLDQNYPNPFNPKTTIPFELNRQSSVSLRIYNVLGATVYTLEKEKSYGPGKYSLEFNAGELPSGVYFYTLTSKEFTATKKMILLK